MSRNSILILSFNACFVVANAIAAMHIYFVIDAAARGEFSIYNYWLEYILIGLSVFMFISILYRRKSKYIACALFYSALLASAIYVTPYIPAFRNVTSGKILMSDMIIISIGFILPIIGVIISGIALYISRDTRSA